MGVRISPESQKNRLILALLSSINFFNKFQDHTKDIFSLYKVFKIRKGYPVGCKVTVRGNRMYDFIERLVSVALPRTRDFRGLSFKSFDGRGNFSFGVKEQIIFTEINYDDIDSIRGMDINISTTAKSDDESYWLLKHIGLPLREKPNKTEESIEVN